MKLLKELLADAQMDSSGVSSSLLRAPIAGIACDSRKVGKDYLFIAVAGARQDGSHFVKEAIERGARVVVAEGDLAVPQEIAFVRTPGTREASWKLASAFHDHPSQALKTIGITGTNGKTTVSYLIEHFLLARGDRAGVVGTVNYRYAGHVIPAVETTPGPLQIQEILAKMRDAGCRCVAMEVSSHALDQQRVGGIDFDVAVFTNLTQDHLDYHKTMERYFEAKSRLFLSLSKKAWAVLNADDERVMTLSKCVEARVMTFGEHASADLRLLKFSGESEGTFFQIAWQGRKIEYHSPLVGRHNVYNALAAIGALAALDVDPAALVSALTHFPGVPGRLEKVACGQDFSVFIDFAHTPDGLENVLSCLRPYCRGKIITVFGCGGDRDRSKRPRMAQIAEKHSDYVVVTSDNPRSEDPRAIAGEVAGGFSTGYKNYVVTLDRRKAIRQALLMAKKGDMVLLAGKGHENVQVLKEGPVPFKDREEAERVLHGR